VLGQHLNAPRNLYPEVEKDLKETCNNGGASKERRSDMGNPPQQRKAKIWRFGRTKK